MKKLIELIAVVGSDNSIGRKGELIKHLPEDLRHFKVITMGGTVVMGRKTWESLPKRPLPGRLNIVITRNSEYKPEGAERAFSIEEAVELAIKKAPEARLFIIGGGQIYKDSFPYADILHLTLLNEGCSDADTFFPEVSTQEWTLKESKEGEQGDYRFNTYERIRSTD